MPDPRLYAQALIAAMLVGAGLNLVSRRVPPIRRSGRAAAAARVLVMIVAAAVGLSFARLLPNVPPRNALDRLLVVLVPATLAVELLINARLIAVRAVAPRESSDASPLTRPPSPVRRRFLATWPFALRLTTGLAAVPVLFYGSVYLHPGSDDWSPVRSFLGITFGAASLIGASESLGRLASRSALLYRTTATCVGATILVSGLLIMMAGYIKGGATAFSLAGVCWGLALVRPSPEQSMAARPDVSFGVTCLFGLVIVGRFFGGLTSGAGVALFVAPLAGWIALVAVQAAANVVRRRRPKIVHDSRSSAATSTETRLVDQPPQTDWSAPIMSRVAAVLYSLLVAVLLGVLLIRGYAQFRQKLGKLAKSFFAERDVAELRVTRSALLGHSLERSCQ